MMDGFLRQSTAKTLLIGPFVDPTSPQTREESLTLTAGEVYLSKDFAAFAAKSSTTDPAHSANGYYSCALNTTDTNTLGSLVIDIVESGTAPIGFLALKPTFWVLPQMVFDSLFAAAGTDYLQVDTVQVGGATALSESDLIDLVNAQVLDCLATDTFAEPGSVPAATATLKDMIHWLFTLARNKMTQTATTTTLRNDADGADIATKSVSDNGTTFTSNEWS